MGLAPVSSLLGIPDPTSRCPGDDGAGYGLIGILEATGMHA